MRPTRGHLRGLVPLLIYSGRLYFFSVLISIFYFLLLLFYLIFLFHGSVKPGCAHFTIPFYDRL